MLATEAPLRYTPNNAGMLPTELEALLIRRSLVRVQVGEPKNTRARK